jgi:hypothetical protein
MTQILTRVQIKREAGTMKQTNESKRAEFSENNKTSSKYELEVWRGAQATTKEMKRKKKGKARE